MAIINVKRASAGLVSFGFSVKPVEGFTDQIEAEKDTQAGQIWIALGERSAVIRKPNGSTKWYYGISDSRLFAYVRQVLAWAEREG